MKAGANVSSSLKTSGAVLEQLSDEVEGLINVVGMYDFVGNYANLDANAKKLLGQIASDLGGAYLITYDFSNYNSRGEAEDMINVLWASASRGLALLKDKNNKFEITGV